MLFVILLAIYTIPCYRFVEVQLLKETMRCMDGNREKLTLNTLQNTPKPLDRPLRSEYQPAISSIRARGQRAGGEEVVDGGEGVGVEVVGQDGDKFGGEVFGAEESVVFVLGGGPCLEEEDCGWLLRHGGVFCWLRAERSGEAECWWC